MKVEKVNNVKIKPLITHTTDPNDVLGGDVFIDPFSNTAMVGRKKSGKTTILYHVLKKVCRKRTNVLIFSSTVHNDDTYKQILEMLEKKKSNVSTFTHFIDNNENIVEGLLDELRQPIVEEPKEKKVKPSPLLRFDETVEEEEAKKSNRKPKKIGADYVLVFDDLGSMMRHKTISTLMKTLRHYKIRTFILSQYLTDLEPQCRKQLDYAILFRNFTDERLKSVYEDLDLPEDFETFKEIYDFATSEPYSFLFVDVRRAEYRKNLDEKIILD